MEESTPTASTCPFCYVERTKSQIYDNATEHYCDMHLIKAFARISKVVHSEDLAIKPSKFRELDRRILDKIRNEVAKRNLKVPSFEEKYK